MVKCSFCGRDEHAHIGVHYISNTGIVSYFCSSKCRKNTLKLKRDKKRARWTEAYRINRSKSEAKQELEDKKNAEKKVEVIKKAK